MIFIETSVFTRRVRELLDDDAYATFQKQLVADPSIGDVIEGTGGCVKHESPPKATVNEEEHGSSTTTSFQHHRSRC